MATLGNKRKLVVVSRQTQEITRNNQSQNTSVPGITEEYTTQLSEDIEGRVTKKLSQQFSRTESGILCALSKSDDELLFIPQARTLSKTVPGTSRNIDLKNLEPTGDHSQNDPHPEVEFSTHWTSNSVDFDPKETSHSMSSER